MQTAVCYTSAKISALPVALKVAAMDWFVEVVKHVKGLKALSRSAKRSRAPSRYSEEVNLILVS